MEDYADNGFPAEVGPERSLETIRKSIGKGPYSSNLSPESTAFCRKEILERTHRGFNIILSMTKTIKPFGTAFRISRLASVDQVSHKPCLICNSREEPDTTTPFVNVSTDKGMASKAM